MAFNFGSFAGGLAGGMALGKRIGDTWNEGDLSKESDRLNQKMDDSGKSVANEGGGLSKAMPDAKTATNYADYNNKIAAEDAATFGGGLSSAPTTTVETKPTYTKADYYSDMGRKAANLGMTDRADKYDQRSQTETTNQLSQKEQGQRIEKGQIELDQAKTEQASKVRLDTFYANVDAAHQEAAKNGSALSWDQIQEMGRSAGLKPGEVMTAASTLTGLDEQGTKYTAGMRVAQFDKAYYTAGLDGVAKLYNENPLFANGMQMAVQRGKDGSVTLMNGKTQMFQGTEPEAAAFMRNHLADPINAVKFQMEVLLNRAKLRESAANITQSNASANASNASATNSLASAGKTRTETDQLKKVGGALKPDDVRQNANAAVKQVLLATGLAKQDPVGNLFMQDGKADSSEQDIANLSAQAENLVRQGVPPYQAAQQVIQGRTAAKAAAATTAAQKQKRPALTSFDK